MACDQVGFGLGDLRSGDNIPNYETRFMYSTLLA